MTRRNNFKEDRDNFSFKGRRKYSSKRPKKGNRKQSRVGDKPTAERSYSLKEDDNINEDLILDDYYTGEEDSFEKFPKRKNGPNG